jgi:hypothetical protein
MRRILQSIVAATCLWGTAVPAAHAASPALVDCPLRDAPYSTSTPLIDILLNDRAKAVADKALPGGRIRVGRPRRQPAGFVSYAAVRSPWPS